MVYWITGRSGAGKTTYAWKLALSVREGGLPVLLLDGEDVRKHFPTGYSDEDRYNHIMRVAKIAALVESQHIVVFVAMVSPKKKWRQEARKLFKKSKLIYLPGGTLWEGTTYEEPDQEEKLIQGGK